MSKRPARATQAEMERALRAAAALSADGRHYALEVSPDGTLRLVPVAAPAPAPAATATRNRPRL